MTGDRTHEELLSEKAERQAEEEKPRAEWRNSENSTFWRATPGWSALL